VLVPKQEISHDHEVLEPLYEAIGGSSLLQGVENRLIRAGKLLTATAMRARVMTVSHALRALFGETRTSDLRLIEEFDKKRDRAEYDGALRANSAFQRLIERKASPSDLISAAGDRFLIANCGLTAFSEYEAQWIQSGMKGPTFTSSDLSYSEDMYLEDEISMNKVLRVPDIMLKPEFMGRNHVYKRTVARAGLWQVSSTMEEWATDTVNQLLDRKAKFKSLSSLMSPLFIIKIESGFQTTLCWCRERLIFRRDSRPRRS
jgi:hypothetical protein